MKKRIMAVCLMVAMVMSLTACGKFTCDLCGKEKSGKQYTYVLFGNEIVYCKDCKQNVEDMKATGKEILSIFSGNSDK